MIRIAITGGSGFVGSNLIPFLEGKKHIITLISRAQLESSQQLVLDPTDVVIHMAGKAHDLRHIASPQDYYNVNYEGTKKVYNAFLASQAAKFIFISSVKACADQVLDVLTESSIADPKTDYGKSKLLAEKYILEKTLPIDKAFYILRPCMIHGPGNKGNLNLLYNFVKKGIPYPLAGFLNKRSFLSVQNLCFVINEFLKQNIPSGIYQVADKEPLSTNEVITILSSPKKARLWSVSPFLIRFLSQIGDKLHFPLNTERLNKLTESYVVSNAKLIKAIKKQLPLSSKEGLKITAESFRDQINK